MGFPAAKNTTSLSLVCLSLANVLCQVATRLVYPGSAIATIPVRHPSRAFHPYSITLISNILLPRPDETGCRIVVHATIASASKPLGTTQVSAHILNQYVHHVILLRKGSNLSHRSPQAGTCPRWKWATLGVVELCEYPTAPACRAMSLPRRSQYVKHLIQGTREHRFLYLNGNEGLLPIVLHTVQDACPQIPQICHDPTSRCCRTRDLYKHLPSPIHRLWHNVWQRRRFLQIF